MTYADVTSANVVGYQNNGLTNGLQGAGLTFIPVSGEGTMRMLTVNGYGDSYTDGNILAAKLNTLGVQIQDMYWIDYQPDYYGWYSDQDASDDLTDTPIAPGQGLWVQADGDLNFQGSGQVQMGTTDVALTNGLQLVCNPTPRTIKMGEIEISGYGDSYTDGNILAAKLNTLGVQIQDMYWIDYQPDYYGWYIDQDASEELNDVEVKPGECLWTQADQDLTMTFPEAIKKD